MNRTLLEYDLFTKSKNGLLQILNICTVPLQIYCCKYDLFTKSKNGLLLEYDLFTKSKNGFFTGILTSNQNSYWKINTHDKYLKFLLSTTLKYKVVNL
jgi:hypothetical protein